MSYLRNIQIHSLLSHIQKASLIYTLSDLIPDLEFTCVLVLKNPLVIPQACASEDCDSELLYCHKGAWPRPGKTDLVWSDPCSQMLLPCLGSVCANPCYVQRMELDVNLTVILLPLWLTELTACLLCFHKFWVGPNFPSVSLS
jgi:hypothetical protein